MRLKIGLLVAGAVAIILMVAAPAVALETTTFGIDVAQPTEDGRLRIPIAAGETASGELRVWNKQETPMVLRLSVAPARVAADGTASLGGDDEEPVGWVQVDDRVELSPGEERRVVVRVTVPREISETTRTVAVLATPEQGDNPAVLQRLAITTYLVPDKDSLIASLGWLPWLAVALVAGVLVGVVLRVRRRAVH